jgi:hypothetical protein
MGRPPKPEARSTPRAIRISERVNEYLSEVGSGIVEELIRKSKGFKQWLKGREAEK